MASYSVAVQMTHWSEISTHTKSLRPLLRGLARDRYFSLAILVGPLVWLGFVFIGPPGFVAGLSLTPWPKLLILAGLYPLLEEWLFRGLVQPLLLKTSIGCRIVLKLSVANWMTTALFVAVHVLNRPGFLALPLLFPSLVFGAFRDKYGSLVPALLLHSYYNLGYFSIISPL